MGGIDRYGKNKGVDARTDKDKRGMRDQSNEGVMEALERKAAQYEKLSRGEYDEKDADKYDVDFHRKGAIGAGGDPMAALEEEARKRTMGPNIGFDYGGGGIYGGAVSNGTACYGGVCYANVTGCMTACDAECLDRAGLTRRPLYVREVRARANRAPLVDGASVLVQRVGGGGGSVLFRVGL